MEVPVAEPRDWLEDSTVVSGCQGTRGEKSREPRGGEGHVQGHVTASVRGRVGGRGPGGGPQQGEVALQNTPPGVPKLNEVGRIHIKHMWCSACSAMQSTCRVLVALCRPKAGDKKGFLRVCYSLKNSCIYFMH